MRDLLTSLGEVFGAALIVAGVALVAVPAALVVAGGFVIVGCWLVGR